MTALYSRRERLCITAVLVVIAIVHGASFLYLSQLSARNPEVPPYPIVAGDSQRYALLADNLNAHHVFSDSQALTPSRQWPPGYPLLLAAVKEVTGSYAPVVIVQTLLMLLSLFLLYDISRRYVPYQFALSIVLLWGLDPMLVLADTTVLTDGLFAALLMSAVYCGFFFDRLRIVPRAALTATLITLAALVRPIAEFLIVIIPFAYIVRQWWNNTAFAEEGKRAAMIACIVYIVVSGAILAPWLLRNHHIFGSYEIAHIGASDILAYDVRYFLAWRELEKTSQTAPWYPAHHLSDPSLAIADTAISDELSKNGNRELPTALHFIFGDPLGYAYFHLAQSVPFFLAGDINAYLQIVHQERDNTDFSSSTLDQASVAIGELRDPHLVGSAVRTLAPVVIDIGYMAMLCLLALIGVIARRRSIDTWLYVGMIAYFALLTGALALARYRIPAQPFILVLAAFGASEIAQWVQHAESPNARRAKKIIRYLISGGTGLAINVAVYSALVYIAGVWYVAASVAAFLIALIASFAMQKFFAFRDNTPPRHGEQFARYFLFMLFNMACNAILLYVAVDHAGFGRLIGIILSNGIIAIWSYFVYDRILFPVQKVSAVQTGSGATLGSVTVVIPCYNEAGALPSVISATPNGVCKIIVVDNNSNDGSAEVARGLGARTLLEKRQGYGAALKCGFLSARSEYIAAYDADNQYPADELPRMLEFLVANGLDFVSASRFPLDDPTSMNLLRRVGNWGLTFATNVLFGLSLADSQSGMWLFRRSLLPRIMPKSDDMPLSQELKIRAATGKSIRFAEYHIPYRVRIGESKLFPFRHGVKLLIALAVLRFKK